MKNSKNGGLGAIRAEMTKDADKANPKNSRIFKKATNFVLDYFENCLGVTPQNVEFLDGYFIFGHGKNSVIEFTVKELKGWRFGLWWEKYDENDKLLEGEFFAQHELNIDKFKPAASEYCKTLYLEEKDLKEKPFHALLYPVKEIVDFIKFHPSLAWLRDASFIDYNYHKVSDFKAWVAYRKEKSRARRIKFCQKNDSKVITKKLPKLFEPYADGVKILDLGETTSPRYNLIITGLYKEVVPQRFYEAAELLEEKDLKKFYKLNHRQNFIKKLLGVAYGYNQNEILYVPILVKEKTRKNTKKRVDKTK